MEFGCAGNVEVGPGAHQRYKVWVGCQGVELDGICNRTWYD